MSAEGDLDEDYWVYAPSVGVFYQFDPTLRASLGVGYFYQQIENDDDQQGPFFTADINKLWDFQRWSIRARGSSGIDSQDFSDENEGFERFGQAELIGRYNFTRDFFGEIYVELVSKPRITPAGKARAAQALAPRAGRFENGVPPQVG